MTVKVSPTVSDSRPALVTLHGGQDVIVTKMTKGQHHVIITDHVITGVHAAVVDSLQALGNAHLCCHPTERASCTAGIARKSVSWLTTAASN